MKILEKEFNDLPGVGKGEWIKRIISVSVTREQIQEINTITGLDTSLMIENMITDEVYRDISRIISKLVRNKRPTEIKWIENSAYWLSDLLHKSDPRFILTNLRVGAGLQQMKQFESLNMKDQVIVSGALYELGKFDGVTVYIDPMMMYEEEELAIVENDFLEYRIDEKSAWIVLEETMTPEISINYEYKINEIKSNLYFINNLQL